jgi:ABC-type glycerol-3-phosphate transport system permease component
VPILSRVGWRSPGQIAARTTFYALLGLGAVASIYPLLLIFGQATSDRFDLRDNAILPRYLFDRNELALKHVYSHSPRLSWLAARHHRVGWTTHPRMRADADFLHELERTVRAQGFTERSHEAVLRDFRAFKRTLGPGDRLPKAFRSDDYYRPFLIERYEERAKALAAAVERGAAPPGWLRQVFPDEAARRSVMRSRRRLALAVMNHEFGSDYPTFYSVEPMPQGNLVVPVWRPPSGPKADMWRDFLGSLPAERTWVVNSDVFWHDYLRGRYDGKIELLNEGWGTDHRGFYELRLPLEPPRAAPVRADWDRFVVARWPRRLLRLPPKHAPAWRAFLGERLRRRVGAEADDAALLEEGRSFAGLKAAAWDKVALPRAWPAHRTLGRLWAEFSSSGAVPAEDMVLDAVETRFRRFLRERHAPRGDEAAALAAVNRSWGTGFAALAEVPLPVELADLVEVTSSPTSLRWSHAVESFGRVTEYITGRGRAIRNTVILIVLSLLSALTINPLAAYSLSRFSMRQSHKVLIFFLATMAFPAEVTMIPNFLLMRDLGLLNTYAALVLPTMANGFSIFLLKCFFDSLPRELYEAAEIDGASELQCFRMVALPLVLPIMAYIGLNTFVLAYGSFMWAFVICPEQDMWTLMVWVYDFQSRNPGENYVMASVLLMTLPPLVVFLFANRIIMRGIMIPQMK